MNIEGYVLVAESDDLSRRSVVDCMVRSLKVNREKIHVVTNGKELSDATNGITYDLIYARNNLPGMKAIEALQNQRYNPKNPNYNTPAILVTGGLASDITEESAALGLERIFALGTPFTAHELGSTIKSI